MPKIKTLWGRSRPQPSGRADFTVAFGTFGADLASPAGFEPALPRYSGAPGVQRQLAEASPTRR
jgi:hypothetical protein